jgi:hypothetical protein
VSCGLISDRSLLIKSDLRIDVECKPKWGSVREIWVDRLIWNIFMDVIWNFEMNWVRWNIDDITSVKWLWSGSDRKVLTSECVQLCRKCECKAQQGSVRKKESGKRIWNTIVNVVWNFKGDWWTWNIDSWTDNITVWVKK